MSFIVLFGVILSMRATMQMGGHADLASWRRLDVRVIPPGPSRGPDVLAGGRLLELPGQGLPALAEGEAARHSELGTRHSELETRNSEPGTHGVVLARAPAVLPGPMGPAAPPVRAAVPSDPPPAPSGDSGFRISDATRNSELGTRNLELGTRNLELGTRNSELGTFRDPDAKPAGIRYTVQANDSLTVLSTRFYGTCRLWERIYEANKAVLASPDLLRVGQEIVIPDVSAPGRPSEPAPGPASPPAAAPSPAPSDPPSEPPPARPPCDMSATELAQVLGTQTDLVEAPIRPVAVYTVQPGDTFSRIAEKVYGDGGKARLLQVRNHHLVPDARRLQPGTRILLLEGAPMAAAEGVALVQ
jgi:nucleoid-associated protein YgaU